MEGYNSLNILSYPLITDYYDPFHSYEIGEYCLFNGQLYKSRHSENIHNIPHQNSEDWFLTTIMYEIKSSQNQISNFINQLIENGGIDDIVVYDEEIADLTNKLNILTLRVDELSYIEILITSFSASTTKIEKGSVLNSLTLNYAINKLPTSLTLDNNELTPALSGTINLTNLNLSANKTYTLRAEDEKEAISTKTVTVSFLNKVYYGVSEIPEYINNNFLLNLSGKQLSSSKYSPFTVNATTDKYIWYAVPSSFGSCNFNVGGFDGGFSKVSTFYHTNASGYATNYDVYRSDNHSLGNTTVRVS